MPLIFHIQRKEEYTMPSKEQKAAEPAVHSTSDPHAVYYTALEVCNMKKFHVTKKTVLTIAGVTLPLAAAAILLPRLKRGRRARSVRA